MLRMLPRKVSFSVTGILIECSEVIQPFPGVVSCNVSAMLLVIEL